MAYNHFTRASFLILLGVCLSLPALGEIHQWLDEHGNAHFGDKPPQHIDSKRLEVELQTGSVPVIEEKSKQQLLREQAEQENQRLLGEMIKQKTIEKEANVSRCIEARRKLAVLWQDIPVYRDEQGKLRVHWAQDPYQGKRRYISDSQRAAEVNKAGNITIMNCENPGNADEYKQIFNDWYSEQHCAAARAELEHHEKSSSRSSSETIKDKRAAVSKYCK